MITIRMTEEQKERLDAAAHNSRLSCNKHCLVHLGLISKGELMAKEKKKEKQKTVVITVRMTTAQKAKLTEDTFRSGLSMNKYVIKTLGLDKPAVQEDHTELMGS